MNQKLWKQLLPYNLFIDFGASFTKVVGLDSNNSRILDFRVPAPKLRIDEAVGFRIYNPKEYANHALYVYQKAIEQVGIPTNLAISGQVACYLLQDSNDEVLHGVVSWQDSSSASGDYGKEISNIINQLTHCEDGVRPGLPLLSIISNIRSNQNLIEHEIYYVNLTNYLLARILGIKSIEIPIHASEAHASGMYSMLKDKWVVDVLPADIRQKLRFPKVLKKSEMCTEPVSQINYWTPVGDQQAAVAGSAIEKGEYLIHIATGGQVLCKMDEFPEINLKEFQIRPEMYGEGFLATITHLPAGRLFNRLFEKLSEETKELVDWDYLESLRLEVLTQEPVEINVKSINAGQSEFPHLSSFEGSVAKYLISFVNSVANSYIESLNRLPKIPGNRFVFSGGLLTGSKFMSELIESKLPNNAQIRLEASDTSLLGLCKMVENSRRLGT